MVHLQHHEMIKEEELFPDCCNLCIFELEAMAIQLINEQFPIPTNEKEFTELKNPRKDVKKKSKR